MSRLCDDPFGAVRLALGPSCWTSVSRILPMPFLLIQGDFSLSFVHLSKTLSDKTNITPPSPRAYPSARASNVWHHPQFDNIPEAARSADVFSNNNVDPDTREQFSEVTTHAHARLSATSVEEHAVSVTRHGPVKAFIYETRPPAIDRAAEVIVYAHMAFGLIVKGQHETDPDIPMYTPAPCVFCVTNVSRADAAISNKNA
ncbi:hypothetical protein N9O24_00430 [bacterium]|nr:hypothetical protein [bacterium]